MIVFAAISVALEHTTSGIHAGVITFGSFSGQFVTVGDPGNSADFTGYGAVADVFDIMTYEVTNNQYTAFLNSVAAADPHSLYSRNMGSDPGVGGERGGINRSGSSGAYSYSVKTNYGDKPAYHISWLDAARYCNWLHNGATSSASTETGAYTLIGATGANLVAVNPNARYFIPTQDQWYKAAYYKGGSTNAGYWAYATQSNTAPTPVTASPTGIGSAGSYGNFANYASTAIWGPAYLGSNLTSVGTNGGPSYYGTFDMSGNVFELIDLAYPALIRGGNFATNYLDLMAAGGATGVSLSPGDNIEGFRVAGRFSSTLTAAPEPCMSLILLLVCLGIIFFKMLKTARLSSP